MNEVYELPGSFARAAPGGQVNPQRVEGPQLTGSTVRHDDPPVGQSEHIGDVQQIRVRPVDLSDRQGGFRADPPAQPGIGGRTGVLDDVDPGGVQDLEGGHRCLGGHWWRIARIGTGDTGQGHDGQGNRWFHCGSPHGGSCPAGQPSRKLLQHRGLVRLAGIIQTPAS